MKEHTGLYVHIPFCEKKCEYCDFYSITQLDQIDSFVNALLTEIALRAPEFQDTVFYTVFLGGGTPSILQKKHIEQIWRAIYTHFRIAPEGEFSIESNPGTLSYDKLSLFREFGFTRLSMGVQSFNPSELTFLGRIHTVEEVYQNFTNARNAGFSNINIDLMTAFPGITHKSFCHSLEQTLHLNPEHISCYTLIFEPGTVFYKKMQRGDMQPLNEDEEAAYYEIAREILEPQGYQQYEISNFARGFDHACRHNLIYWKHRPYLGLGPSAHSFFRNTRFANKRSLPAYLKSLAKNELPLDFREELSPEQLMFEYTFLSLRLREGVDLNDFRQRFGTDFGKKYHSAIRRLTENKLIEFDDRVLRLSKEGWIVADTVAVYF
jgi:oxygen-independent coproporphyrinogen-3 oxidase